MSLVDIPEDTTDPAGDTVGAIIASAGGDRITDLTDPSPTEGLAVVGVDDTNGSWQYSTDAGANWLAFGAVSDTSAVLLDTTELIRFVPVANYNGSGGRGRRLDQRRLYGLQYGDRDRHDHRDLGQ